MRQLYSTYFQKSSTFLYPLLGLDNSQEMKPVKVFVSWEGRFKAEDRKLICLFRNLSGNQVWENYEVTKLLTHPMLDFCERLDDEYIAYVFDMTNLQEDFDHFLKGKYSKFSGYAKEKISYYFGISSPEFVYIESFLYPEKYHKVYAELLGEKLSTIREVYELCNPYNPEKEELRLKKEPVTQ